RRIQAVTFRTFRAAALHRNENLFTLARTPEDPADCYAWCSAWRSRGQEHPISGTHEPGAITTDHPCLSACIPHPSDARIDTLIYHLPSAVSPSPSPFPSKVSNIPIFPD